MLVLKFDLTISLKKIVESFELLNCLLIDLVII